MARRRRLSNRVSAPMCDLLLKIAAGSTIADHPQRVLRQARLIGPHKVRLTSRGKRLLTLCGRR